MSKRKPAAAVVPRKAPKQQRSRQTFQVILNGAIAVIRRDGIKKLSTNKVAEESKVSIGSLYQYFPSKAAIIGALVELGLEKELEIIDNVLNQFSVNQGAMEPARAFFKHYCCVSSEEMEIRRTMTKIVPQVDRADVALKFQNRMAVYLIEYFTTRFSAEPRDRHTETFILQYLLKGLMLSSVDADIRSLPSTELIDQWSEILLKLVRVPKEKWGPHQPST
jgi:AcrR family transcriptional regulator